MEEKLTVSNVQLACVTSARGFHVYEDAELQAVIGTL
jgi:hypothetical protein